MKTPPALRPGNKIAIVAPARKVKTEELEFAVNLLLEKGFKTVLGENLFGEYNQFSGTDAERASDLQSVLDDKEVKAVFFARGGYGSVRIIDQIDFSNFKSNPKWLIGFSDETVFHSHIQKNFKIETIHGPMPFAFDKVDVSAMDALWEILSGESVKYHVPHHTLNRTGDAEGVLTGGNLSVIYSLMGSDSEIETEGKILFIEDLDEYLYHIDRMMMCLKRSGKLSKIQGLIVGGMNDMKDNSIPFGAQAEGIINHVVDEKIPIAFGFPAGHIPGNLPIVLGRKAKLIVSNSETILSF